MNKVFIERIEANGEAIVTVSRMDGSSLFMAAYTSEKRAINAIKRRLKINTEKNLLVYRKNGSGLYDCEGWR